MFGWKGIRQKFKQSKSEKSKSILFDFFEIKNNPFIPVLTSRLFEIDTFSLFDFLFFDFSTIFEIQTKPFHFSTF